VSTHTRHPTESHPDPDSDAPPPRPPDAPAAAGTDADGGGDADGGPGADADTETHPTDGVDARDDRSGTNRCQRLFSARGTARLRNLADAENHAMPDGV
jgi:hypothetical protein